MAFSQGLSYQHSGSGKLDNKTKKTVSDGNMWGWWLWWMMLHHSSIGAVSCNISIQTSDLLVVTGLEAHKFLPNEKKSFLYICLDFCLVLYQRRMKSWMLIRWNNSHALHHVHSMASWSQHGQSLPAWTSVESLEGSCNAVNLRSWISTLAKVSWATLKLC